MASWISDTLRTGAIASTATTLAAAMLGEAEDGEPVAPINAVSHIVWGDQAATVEEADLRHTVTGLALNAAAVTGWAGIHEMLMPREGTWNLERALTTGAAVSALAYVTDYFIVPKRLTPGFELRLPQRSLFGLYAVLAVSLAVGSLCHRSR